MCRHWRLIYQKGRSDVELGELVGESKDQIRRFIRLTELVPEILQMVDERQIAFRPAVEISYLNEEQQYTLLEAMSYNDATLSLAQAIKMKKFMQEGKLDRRGYPEHYGRRKPNQRKSLLSVTKAITKLIPKSVPKGQGSGFCCKSVGVFFTTDTCSETKLRNDSRTPGGRGLPVLVDSRFLTSPLHTSTPFLLPRLSEKRIYAKLFV